jgi:hypothetical protein
MAGKRKNVPSGTNGEILPEQLPHEGFWMGFLGLLKRMDQEAVLGVIVLAICVGASLKGAETIPTYTLGVVVLAMVYLYRWLLHSRSGGRG